MTERHHYVPQLILRSFAIRDQIWLFDKTTKKSFKTSIKNAFVEGNFNTVIGNAITLEAEQIFCRAEEAAAPVLRSVIEQNNVSHLTIEQHATIAMFAAIQHLRSKQSRRNFELIREALKTKFPEISKSDHLSELFAPTEIDKYASLDFIVKNLDHVSNMFAEKDLLLVESPSGGLWISDHPVVLHNDRRHEDYSSLGIQVPGIQIYFPLSPHLAIAFYCSTIVQEFETAVQRFADLRAKTFTEAFRKGLIGETLTFSLAEMKLKQAQIEKQIDAIKIKKKVIFNSDNLTFLNSLQMLSAHRFLGAQENSFSLAKEMLHDNPELSHVDHIQFA